MIGAQAITGGLIASIFLLGIAALLFALLVVGIGLSRTRRKRFGISLIVTSIVGLLGLSVWLFAVLHVPRIATQLDLSRGNLAIWKGDLSSCQTVVEERLCFPKSARYTVDLQFPDKLLATVIGEQFFVRINRQSFINGLDIALAPEPRAAEIEVMIDSESARAETSRAFCGESSAGTPTAKFKHWAVAASERTSPCRLEFQHPAYSTSFEITPSISQRGAFFVWYRVKVERAAISPSDKAS